MQVFCYMNLHRSTPGRPVYSVMDAKTRRVIAWEEKIFLTDVWFKVSEAGRQRVLREKRKAVHAYVCGEWTSNEVLTNRYGSYNPYKGEHFFDRETGEALHTAPFARLDAQGLSYSKMANEAV